MPLPALPRCPPALLVAAALTVAPSPLPALPALPADPDRPDIVVITIDTLRADHVGWHGYVRDTTPELDRLAQESIVFERCLAPMATTLPTHTSLFTSTYPLEHGVVANTLAGKVVPERAPKLAVLAQFLKEVGYETIAVPSATPLTRRFGLDTGFDAYQKLWGHERAATKATDVALEQLPRESKRPLFLWVHYFDPHSPYAPPERFQDVFERDERIEEYVRARGFAEVADRPTGKSNHLWEGLDTYDGEVRYVDEEIGRLLARLRERAWERTVVLLLADHGEGLNQHGEPGHGLVWDEQLHVPLLMRVPGQAPRRVATQLSVVDVVPTLLGLVPLPGSERFLEQSSGFDVLHDDHVERAVFGMSSERQLEFGRWAYALTTPRWKLVVEEDGVERLYDLRADPFELHDVRADHADQAATLRAELDALVERQLERGRTFGAGGRRELGPRERSGLEALGYIGGDEEED